jgi:hypothetical protein
MSEPVSTSVLAGVIMKFGSLKLFGGFAAIIGALIMTIFRPPKSRRELFMQCTVALGSSFLFGGAVMRALAYYFGWADLKDAPIEEIIQMTAAVHGLLGACAWGVFGGLSVLRDKISSDPIQLAKDVKEIV